MNCKYKVNIKDIQYNYKVSMENIQSKYKFKIFCSGYDDTEIKEKINTMYEAWPKVSGEGETVSLSNTVTAPVTIGLKGNTSQATLPSEYTAVDYIQSSGTQYIDSEYVPKANTKIEVDCFIPEETTSHWRSIFGARISNYKNKAIAFFTNTSTQNVTVYCRTGVETRGHKFIYDRDVHIVAEGQTATFSDGTDSYSITTTGTVEDCQNTMFIFNLNTASTPTGKTPDISYAIMKLYNFKCYEDNTLMRNFIPCYRNSDNEVGLYDLVNGVFYTNAGTGAFTYGAVVTLPSPDYPQDIHVVSGDNSIIVSNSDNTQSQSYPINLGDIELCKIGNYQDSIVKDNGKWYLNKQIGKIVLNGSESFDWNATYVEGSSSYALWNKYTDMDIPVGLPITKYCNRFPYENKVWTFSSTNHLAENSLTTPSNYSILFNVATSIATTSAEFKTWLSTHNTEVYYVLATPTYTEITDSTLISQLEAIAGAEGYTGQTNISQTNSDKPFIITATTLKDLSSL